MGSMVALPVLIFFINRPDVLLFLIIATYSSRLYLPGIPAQLELVDLLQVLFICICIAKAALIHGNYAIELKHSVLLTLLLLNVALVIMIRGAGFRALGGDQWGGFRYVPLIINALFLLNIRMIRMTPAMWKWAILSMFAMSFIPAMAEVIAVVTNGKVSFQYNFIQLAESTVNAAQNFASGGSRVVRFASLGSLGGGLFMLAFLIRIPGKLRFLPPIIFLFLAFILRAMTGHRLALISSIIFCWIYGMNYFFQRKKLGRYISVSVLIALSSATIIYLIAPKLPDAAQRAISFLPGVNINLHVQLDADHSSQWRLNLWQDAIQEIPEYWLIGKGFTFPSYAVQSHSGVIDLAEMHEWAVVTSTYHNGPLSLLIGFGISGLLIGSALFITPHIYHAKMQQSSWRDPFLQRVHLVILIQSIVSMIIFFSVYGDAPSDLATLFFRIALLEGLILGGTEQNLHST